MPMIVEVIISSNAKDLNKIFDYNVPAKFVGTINIGSKVLVSFGKIKKPQEGFVVGIKEESEYKVKDILNITKDNLDEDKIELAKLMAHKYFCNISDCIKLMLPPGTSSKNIENRIKERCMKFVYLRKDEDEIQEEIDNKKLKSEKQIRTLEFLMSNEEVLLSELIGFADTSSSVVKTLQKNGYIEIIEKEVARNPFKDKNIPKTQKLILTKEQQKAKNRIEGAINDKIFKEFLIYRCNTDHGKTEIYLQLIDEILEKNKTAIMLVPEISLTPQMVDRFIARFGEEKIALLHSKLSVGERYDEWKRIEKGEAKIVIGARSAIFAPISNLGIIIIDEEHDQSYKSDMTPKYNAKEIALYLAKKNNIPLVLGSATPDIGTYYTMENTQNILVLSERANTSSLPNVEIVDMKNELVIGNKSMISNRLYEMIDNNIKNKKQTILFLNRRGYSTFVMCRECGYTANCNKCNITLTYHIKQDKLKCHYCGYERKNFTECPECGSKNIRHFGTGTQKLEMQINESFPDATTIRMDIDTVTKKNSYVDILNKFKNENIDILIGTQMVVKGHHFPNVTLVRCYCSR